MAMMLGECAVHGKKAGPADAHDAGRGRGIWEIGGPADAHDAGRGCGKRKMGGPTDAHDAGCWRS